MAGEKLLFRLRDYSKEDSAVSMHVGAVTAVSLPGLLTQIGTLRTAIDGITLGVVGSEALTAFDSNLSTALPVSEDAQRERKWLVRYVDNLPFFDDPVNAIPNEGYKKVFTFEIACADIATRLNANSDEANLANAGIAAFKTAFEAIARSPYGGTVTVLKLIAVGRNL